MKLHKYTTSGEAYFLGVFGKDSLLLLVVVASNTNALTSTIRLMSVHFPAHFLVSSAT